MDDSSAEPDRTPSAVVGHRAVWQVADGGTDMHRRFLRSVANLLVDLDADGVQVEVVAHGAGLDLLLPDSGTADAVAELQARNVRFLACENTLRSRQLAVEDLLPQVASVTSGVGAIIRRQSQGWSYLRA